MALNMDNIKLIHELTLIALSIGIGVFSSHLGETRKLMSLILITVAALLIVKLANLWGIDLTYM
jgi:hypothetical protein